MEELFGIVLFVHKISKKEEKTTKTNRLQLQKKEEFNEKINKNNSQIILLMRKLKEYIKQMIIVAVSANIIIIPIMMYHFNTISFTFLISNILASPILGMCIILGMIFIILSLIFKPIAQIISYFLQPILKLLIYISNISGNLPFSQVLVPTPKIWQIVLYYFFIFFIFSRKIILNNILKIVNKKQKKFKNKVLKFQKLFIITIIILIISPYVFSVFPTGKLEINFIDVGQGDSMLIKTPSNKTILVDGGGSETGSFDTGEKTLLPYLLDKGIMKIDYMLFTHMDSDHCQGLFTILEKIKVKNIIISKQGEDSANFQKLLQILKNKKKKVIVVKAGDIIQIDKKCSLNVLFPTDELISANVLNNNSIVAKFCYKQNTKTSEFSMLLTGDIEEIAEKQIIAMYEQTNILNSTILKVAHHGSKTSSIQEFLDLVKPKISVIGVGANNKFGHPNEGVIERLNNIRFKSL